MPTPNIEQIRLLLSGCTQEERDDLFRELSRDARLHDLERQWNVSAHVIMDAIVRSNDLTQRGIRGVIAESSFNVNVVLPLTKKGWESTVIIGDQSYDFVICDTQGNVSIQVKLQRRKEQRAMLAYEANKTFFQPIPEMYVVETQKTRAGKDSTGGDTRPYRFGEFDILAVSLHPSTGDWTRFRCTLGKWLRPDPKNSRQIFKYQAVPMRPGNNWTDDLEECISWFRSNKEKESEKTSQTTVDIFQAIEGLKES